MTHSFICRCSSQAAIAGLRPKKGLCICEILRFAGPDWPPGIIPGPPVASLDLLASWPVSVSTQCFGDKHCFLLGYFYINIFYSKIFNSKIQTNDLLYKS